MKKAPFPGLFWLSYLMGGALSGDSDVRISDMNRSYMRLYMVNMGR